MEAMNESMLEWSVATHTPPGHARSGDRHVLSFFTNGVLLGAVDGLGHGEEAAVAAERAVATATKHAGESVIALFKHCHAHLRETRGVVMSLASINAEEGSMTWMGVGNVEGVVLRPAATGPQRFEPLLLRGGVVGGHLPPLYAAIIPFTRGDTVVFATDGVYGGFTAGLLAGEPPKQTAERLLAQYGKGSDDALVLVAHYRGGA
jgi:hypothetical protein